MMMEKMLFEVPKNMFLFHVTSFLSGFVFLFYFDPFVVISGLCI